MRSTLLRGCAALALLGASGATAQAPAAAGRVQFEDYRLPNGLRVLLAPDPASPVVAVDVWYAVGSRDERPGRTGFAHLFEHMMFQGSENVGKGEHFKLVERAGGADFNGTTNADRTNYYEVLPANRLNLGLWLEADRMRSLAVTPENFANQRDVVKEERRLRVENAPYSPALNAMLTDSLYNARGCYGYAHPTIGSMDDLNAATVEDVRAFHGLYYRPNNATLTVSGGFDPAEARRLVQEYFAGIPAGPAAPRATCTEPFAGLPSRRSFSDRNAQLPAVFAAYGLPPASSPDFAALRLLNVILAGGESSRLNERLVQRERAAAQLGPILFEWQGPSVVGYVVLANQGVSADRIQALLEEEVARVRDQGVTPAELEKAKNQLRASVVMERQTALGVAEALQSAAFVHGDPGYVNRSLDAAMAATPADLQRVARQYLAPTNRALAIVQ
ncbi:MAG TPA: pitrilysin family protein, partial [Longimicrobium sp.]|nr:pitrilysin family protein [Longimicrobium sp.]